MQLKTIAYMYLACPTCKAAPEEACRTKRVCAERLALARRIANTPEYMRLSKRERRAYLQKVPV